jgi:hypothetical protein
VINILAKEIEDVPVCGTGFLSLQFNSFKKMIHRFGPFLPLAIVLASCLNTEAGV